MPTKVGFHAFHINLYLHELLSRFYFWPPLTIAHGPKGNFDHFEGKRKRGKISKTGEVTHTKIGLHAFRVNLYLHEFFERILFFDPHGL